MRPQLGPVLSVVRAAAHAEARIVGYGEVRLALGYSPAEQALAVPRHVAITDTDAESRARTERRWKQEG